MSAIAVKEPEGTVEERLAGLAETARREHESTEAAVGEALSHAIAAGQALLEARNLVPTGTWEMWIQENFPAAYVTASIYMRLAFYQEIVPGGLSLTGARKWLIGLPAINGTTAGTIPTYPSEIKEEAKRLRREGLSYADIADRLDIAVSTVGNWITGKSPRSRAQARQSRRAQAKRAEQALRRQEAEHELKRRGGSLAEGYSLLRRAAQALDAASAQEPSPEAKRHMRLAWQAVHDAEREVMRALGVAYGTEAA